MAFSVAGCQGEPGPIGQAGPAGEQGPKGDPGEAGVSCTAKTSGGTKTIECTDGTKITVADGTDGADGKDGKDGKNAVDSGVLTGTLTSTVAGTTFPAERVTVSATPGTATATSDKDGKFSLTLPVGLYKITFASDEYTKVEVANVSVVGGGTPVVDGKLAWNPTKASLVATVQQAGFANEVSLTIAADEVGANKTWKWTQVSGPAGALDSATAASPKLTTPAFEDAIKPLRAFPRPERLGFLGVTAQQVKDMAMVFMATVSDGTKTFRKKVTVNMATPEAGMGRHPVGIIAIANDVSGKSTYAWTLKKGTSDVTGTLLKGANTRNPWFIPAEADTYTLSNGTKDLTLVVDTFSGTWREGTTAAGCAMCHSEGKSSAFPQYAEWAGSGHANLFKEEIDGAEGDHYSANCISCHTTGYTPADNGGFDDVAKAKGWTFPTPPKAGEWDKVKAIPELRKLASISCENCHGPAAAHAEAETAPTASLSAGACAVCHDSLTHHDRFPLWARSPHANMVNALSAGTRANSSGCARCHAGQGYIAWAAAGDFSKGLPSTYVARTAADVETVTCAVCHDPHSGELRVEGSAGKVAAGFEANHLGAGALCATCHNTRNGSSGLREGNNPVPSFQAPHVAAQTDVFMGRNLYFVATGEFNKHSTIKDTCVGCHMNLIPANGKGDFACAKDDDCLSGRCNPTGTCQGVWNTNHAFRTDHTICASCHGSYDGGGMTETVEENLVEIRESLEAGILKALTKATASAGPGFKVVATDDAKGGDKGAATITEAPVKVELEESHGQMAVLLTFAEPGVDVSWNGAEPVKQTVLDVKLGNLLENNTSGKSFFAPDSDLGRAGWNYFIVHGDGSMGAHNPSFVTEALHQTKQKAAAWAAAQ